MTTDQQIKTISDRITGLLRKKDDYRIRKQHHNNKYILYQKGELELSKGQFINLCVAYLACVKGFEKCKYKLALLSSDRKKLFKLFKLRDNK